MLQNMKTLPCVSIAFGNKQQAVLSLSLTSTLNHEVVVTSTSLFSHYFSSLSGCLLKQEGFRQLLLLCVKVSIPSAFSYAAKALLILPVMLMR